MIKPLNDIVVAIVKEKSNVTESGLYVSEDSKKPTTAVVVSVGENVEKVNVSDEIVYKQFEFTSLKLNKVDYVLVKEENILAVITND